MAYYAVSPYDPAVLLPEIRRQILTSPPTSHWMALIDGAFDYEDKTALHWSTPDYPVYFREDLAALERVSPRLIALSTHEPKKLRQELAQLLSHATGRPMLSILQSSFSCEALRESWQAALEVQSADSQAFLLRFADTRTLPDIAEILADSAWALLSQPIQQWHIINRNGEWQSLPPNNTGSGKAPLVLTDAQLAQISDASLPDALIDHIHENFPQYLPERPSAITHRQMQMVCRLAAQHGLHLFSDQLSLALAVRMTKGKLLGNASLSPWLATQGNSQGELGKNIPEFLARLSL